MSKEYIVPAPLELIQGLQDSFNNGVVFEHIRSGGQAICSDLHE